MECFLFLKENYSWDEMRGRARAGAVLSPSCLMLGTSPVGRYGCLKRQVLRGSLDGNFQICAGGLLRAWWQVLSNYVETRKRGSECDSVWHMVTAGLRGILLSGQSQPSELWQRPGQNCHRGHAQNACLVPVSSYFAGNGDKVSYLFSKYLAESKHCRENKRSLKKLHKTVLSPWKHTM